MVAAHADIKMVRVVAVIGSRLAWFERSEKQLG